MRIVFLSQLLPLPLDAGPKIRSYYVLRYLAEAGHEITLVCFVRPGDGEHHLQPLRKICRSVHTVPISRSRLNDAAQGFKSLFSKTPFLVSRDRLPEMTRTIRGISTGRTFDALHADQLWMASYGLEYPGSPLKVLDQHNAVFKVPLQLAAYQANPLIRLFLRKEAAGLARYERVTCGKFDQTVWVTAEDRSAVLTNGAGELPNHRVIPIAVDTSARTPVKRPEPFRITFLGGMHWPPNAEGISWFADKIWPAVARAVPEAVLTLIGRDAPGKVLRATAGDRIQATGHLQEIEPYLKETAAFIVPLRSGAGMRVKILDAWCWGLPVISTSIGAEGIRAVHDENLLIADDADGFARCCIRVFQDAALAGRLSANGRAAVESRYDWKRIYPAWDRIYH